MLLPFEQGPIRPVDEADSLLIRTTRGCPWNRCTFCFIYRDMRFSLRSLEEIQADIRAASDYFGGHRFRSCFLQDGDSFMMKTGKLIAVLACLKDHFPHLERISSYGRAQTLIRKSPEEMREICSAGLNTLYCGMESGSARVLEQVRKGSTPRSIIDSGRMALEAGMSITEFIISGLAGKDLWQEHALETARVLNAINPNRIRVLTIGVKDGSDLHHQMTEGDFQLSSEKAIIEEQRLMVENLDGITSHYANHHAIDLLIEIRGQLPDEKERILGVFDRFLGLPEDVQTHFILGRRMGVYQRLDDLSDPARFAWVDRQVREIKATAPDRFETIFHRLRQQVI